MFLVGLISIKQVFFCLFFERANKELQFSSLLIEEKREKLLVSLNEKSSARHKRWLHVGPAPAGTPGKKVKNRFLRLVFLKANFNLCSLRSFAFATARFVFSSQESMFGKRNFGASVPS